MSEQEHLLVCLAEECAEVQQRITKALRFGLMEIQARGPSISDNEDADMTNRDRIMYEMADLQSVFRQLVDYGILPAPVPEDWEAAHVKKKAKVAKYLQYAIKIGQVKV